MINVLHGEDLEQSYKRLSQLISSYPDFLKVRLEESATKDELVLSLYSDDLLSSKKLIICTNFIKDKKLPKLEKLSDSNILVLWEKNQLTQAALAKLPRGTQIENFKPKPQLFWFLDSLTPPVAHALKSLVALGDEEDNLLWNVTNRLLMLILAKQGTTQEEASEILNRNLAPWQWQKVKDQAKMFDQGQLKKMYTGALRVDYMIKTGRTNLEEKVLLPILLLKYLDK